MNSGGLHREIFSRQEGCEVWPDSDFGYRKGRHWTVALRQREQRIPSHETNYYERRDLEEQRGGDQPNMCQETTSNG